MFRSPKTIAEKVIPADYRLIVYGWIIGMLTGIAFVGDSVDFAAAIGIAAFLTVSVGGFAGVRTSLLIMRGFRVWIDSLRDRTRALESRLHPVAHQPENDTTTANPAAGGFSVARLCVIATVLGTTMMAQGAVMAIIQLGVDLGGPIWYAALLIPGSVLTLFGVVGQVLALTLVSLAISNIEKHLNAVEAGIPTPVAMRPYRMDLAISSTQSWVCKLTGVCESGAQRIAA